jgi:hypothetical protein
MQHINFLNIAAMGVLRAIAIFANELIDSYKWGYWCISHVSNPFKNKLIL